MELVELDRLVVRVERRDQGIACRLDQPVGHGDDQGAGEEGREAAGQDQDQGASEVADEGHPQQEPHPQGIAERREDHLRHREAPERRTADPADLGVVEAELAFEGEHHRADRRKGH